MRISQKNLFAVAGSSVVLAWAAAAMAIGGGGGSPPPCTRDDWVCSSWSSCIGGTRTRNCSLSSDCPGVVTPRPAESEQCVAPCTEDTWSCSQWGACSDGVRTRTCSLVKECPEVETPKPEEREACVTAEPGCRADTWSCEEWAACDRHGVQRRDCRLTADCPGVQTAKPVTDRACPTLQCGNLPSLRERVGCRLGLAPAGLARELEIQYLPELCRAQAQGEARDACISLYKNFDPCWSAPTAEERASCAKGVLGLQADVREQMIACLEQEEPDRSACAEALRKRVYDLVLFRLYDLEERAEDLLERNVPVDVVADLVTAVEEKKIEFRAATTKEARRQAVLDVRAAWKQFVLKVKTYLR